VRSCGLAARRREGGKGGREGGREVTILQCTGSFSPLGFIGGWLSPRGSLQKGKGEREEEGEGEGEGEGEEEGEGEGVELQWQGQSVEQA